MKIRLFIYYSIYILTISFTIVINQSYANPIDDIKNLLKVNEDDAKKILRSVGVLIRSVEHGISTVADSDHNYKDKVGENGLIKGIISDNFSSEEATIYVSSLNSSKNEEYSVKGYLKHLALLSQNGRYHNVKIYFDKGMVLSNISKNENRTEMNIDVFQLFKGCKNIEGTSKCYSDVTKKTFVVKIDHNYGAIGKSRMYIDALGVKDTMTVKDAMKIIDTFE